MDVLSTCKFVLLPSSSGSNAASTCCFRLHSILLLRHASFVFRVQSSFLLLSSSSRVPWTFLRNLHSPVLHGISVTTPYKLAVLASDVWLHVLPNTGRQNTHSFREMCCFSLRVCNHIGNQMSWHPQDQQIRFSYIAILRLFHYIPPRTKHL
jgi:hypothetical protein